jgi:MFS transporter, PPP family, 3-phenylpropionic acid transporter
LKSATSPPRAWRLGFLYAAVFLVGGCYLPYLPVWLHWRELTADQIAVLLATPPFARIVFTPAIRFAACPGRRPPADPDRARLGLSRLLPAALAAQGFWQMLLSRACCLPRAGRRSCRWSRR